ncbi:hypothetical protein SETIT_7G256400v2 [Setaria italica]|uniref:Uncharacterized protein n=1 Tax=Setaria italica TaxID=4555 RepID=A0A368S1D7_SETIT|nr:uncharacterized protein LOC101784652 isoform X1 [Setaria italica]RCV35650.1 hypothetical protein SETIT_7G256400v2 [Setaria italica]RCV35651.1 hypothetical protein SETIT_7G256400v2 [Setaria italica]
MDQHKEKEAENKSQDSTAEQLKEAASEESMDQRAGYKAEEESAPAGLLIKEVASGEESWPALLAHPCSLLQLLLRACAGCLGLHGYCSSDDPKAAAAAAPDATAADSSQEGEGGDRANYLYMQAEVLARVRAVRRPPPPGQRPREGSGGNGGAHH